MGHKPAGWFSQVLDEAFEAQLDGVFGDEAGGLDAAVKRLDFSLTFETLNTAPDALT